MPLLLSSDFSCPMAWRLVAWADGTKLPCHGIKYSFSARRWATTSRRIIHFDLSRDSSTASVGQGSHGMAMGVYGVQYKEVDLGDEDVARRGKGDSGLNGSGAAGPVPWS